MSHNHKLDKTLKSLENIRDILQKNNVVDERIDRICEKIDQVLEEILRDIRSGN